MPGHGGETQIFVQMLIDIAQRLGDIDLVGGIVLEAAAVGADDLCPGLLEDLPGGKGMGHGLVLETAAGQGDVPGKKNEVVKAPVQGVEENAPEFADMLRAQGVQNPALLPELGNGLGLALLDQKLTDLLVIVDRIQQSGVFLG